MKSIVLCEGKTDAILISYFMIKQFGWKYSKERTRSNRDFVINPATEQFNIYTRREPSEGELAIWGGDGISDLPRKLALVAERNRDERDPQNRYSRAVVFFDRDTRTSDACVGMIASWLKEAAIECARIPEFGTWGTGTISLNLKPAQRFPQQFLCIVLPPSSTGALETFLLDCLRNESDVDKTIVDEAEKFISSIPSDHPYLKHPRLRPKAWMGSVLSVISPDWVYSDLQTRLTQVQWEKLGSVLSVYNELDKL